YDRLGRDVWVLDLTADLAVPVMAAVSKLRDSPLEQIIFGFGAHRDPRLALRRSLTELNQVMPAADGVRVTGSWAQLGVDAANWWKTATTENQLYLVPDAGKRPSKPQDFSYRPYDDLREDIEILHDRLRAAGLELLVLDQTRPDIGLPCVKVIVPGLRHLWA